MLATLVLLIQQTIDGADMSQFYWTDSSDMDSVKCVARTVSVVLWNSGKMRVISWHAEWDYDYMNLLICQKFHEISDMTVLLHNVYR